MEIKSLSTQPVVDGKSGKFLQSTKHFWSVTGKRDCSRWRLVSKCKKKTREVHKSGFRQFVWFNRSRQKLWKPDLISKEVICTFTNAEIFTVAANSISVHDLDGINNIFSNQSAASVEMKKLSRVIILVGNIYTLICGRAHESIMTKCSLSVELIL